MKTLAILAAGILIAAPAFAQGTINAPNVPRRALPPTSSSAQAEGGLQRGVRLGNPLHMFNPLAPKEYGDGHEFVTARGEDQGLRPRDRSRAVPIGLRLFTIAF